MLRREKARLERAFGLVLAVVAPAAIAACVHDATSSSGALDAGGGGSDGSSGADATGANGDGASTADARGGDAGADAPATPVYCEAGDPLPFDSGIDGEQGCDYVVGFACGLPSGVTPVGCDLYLKDCAKICTKPGNFFSCRVAQGLGCTDAAVTSPQGPLSVECSTCSGVGRRPAALARARFEPATSAVGDWLARAAHLEAASVFAFASLRDELVALGAPAPLVRMAKRAARDEVRHARVTARLARRFGGCPARARVGARRAPSLEALAIENAVEGCVRETFGALVATWQSQRAADAEIARAMESIAVDETRHAALAWAVARWAERRLDAAARARVADARRAAVVALFDETARDVPASLVHDAGLPDASRARSILATLATTIWS